ncbi:hypothetical protein SAMN05445850_6225 [Paraburkholderia tuberum]|uniref:Uncharacterized protein n=1 Tax=Paraburkholderia tuberum TaxID=157910 RepID=A0A1H1K0Z2_9BURK|nr:hypothetical protein SAMN05445850_6225 [Paraburkholderia tuberum]
MDSRRNNRGVVGSVSTRVRERPPFGSSQRVGWLRRQRLATKFRQMERPQADKGLALLTERHAMHQGQGRGVIPVYACFAAVLVEVSELGMCSNGRRVQSTLITDPVTRLCLHYAIEFVS